MHSIGAELAGTQKILANSGFNWELWSLTSAFNEAKAMNFQGQGQKFDLEAKA